MYVFIIFFHNSEKKFSKIVQQQLTLSDGEQDHADYGDELADKFGSQPQLFSAFSSRRFGPPPASPVSCPSVTVASVPDQLLMNIQQGKEASDSSVGRR